MKRIKSDASKKFILTSRTTVLNRGKMLTDKFAIEKIDRDEFELHVDAYDIYDKALLLHSFLWFSGLTPEYIEKIVEGRRYKAVIEHQNFNPRLVAFITDPHRIEEVPAEKYWDYVNEKINNPADVWVNAYDNQINDWSRAILWLVVLSKNFMDEVDVQAAVDRFRSEPLARDFSGEYDYQRCMSLLIGSLLNRSQWESDVSISLFNPSIADYVLRRIGGSTLILTSVLRSLQSESVLSNFGALVRNKLISENTAIQVLKDLTRGINANSSLPSEVAYGASIVSFVQRLGISDAVTIKNCIGFVEQLGRRSDGSKDLPWVAEALVDYLARGIIEMEQVRSYFENLDLEIVNGADLDAAAVIVEIAPTDLKDKCLESFKKAIVEYWQDRIGEEIYDREVLDGLYSEDDRSEAEEIVKKEIKEILDEYPIKFSNEEVREIFIYCDVSDIISDNARRSMNSDESRREDAVTSRTRGDIDDLFFIDSPPKI